jgi:hypothetical protein
MTAGIVDRFEDIFSRYVDSGWACSGRALRRYGTELEAAAEHLPGASRRVAASALSAGAPAGAVTHNGLAFGARELLAVRDAAD